VARLKAMPRLDGDGARKFTISDVDETKAKPGQARSKAGITKASKKRRARS
jgi:hypothetical protein